MTEQEFERVVDNLKKEGHNEEEICGCFALMFENGELTGEQFEAMVNKLGYSLGEEFKNMSEEEQKNFIREESVPTNEEEAKPEQTPESSKDEEDDEKKAMKNFGFKDTQKKAEEEESNDDSEEGQAMKLFGFKK